MTRETAQTPALSVVLPVYNAANFLEAALDSVLSQDFRDFECIAIDDGSTDQSGLILDEYQRRDARMRVLHQDNAGLVETLNRGIELSLAPLIARMDADDICLPGRFAAQMQHFRGRNDLAALGGQIQLINEQGDLLRTADYPASGKELEAFLAKGSPVAHPAVMLRKAAVQEVGLYRKTFRHVEDYDLWLRLHEAGYAIENLKVPLIGYRQHAKKVSIVHRREQTIATLAARCAHRARLAGLPDPTISLERLDEHVFELFPRALINDLRDEIFTARIGMNAFETEEQVAQGLAAFSRLPVDLQRTRRGAGFLLRAALGAWRCHQYSLALASFVGALATAPVKIAVAGVQKLAHFFRRSLSETVLRSREKLDVRRTAGDQYALVDGEKNPSGRARPSRTSKQNVK